MAFSEAILPVPIACTIVTIEPNASGIAATASATANINESIRLTFLIKHKTKTTADIIIIPIASLPLN